MKFKKEHSHNPEERTGKIFKHIPDKLRQYWTNKFSSSKCKRMSQGSYDILRCMSWAHNNNWRRNHPKSLNKQHKK